MASSVGSMQLMRGVGLVLITAITTYSITSQLQAGRCDAIARATAKYVVGSFKNELKAAAVPPPLPALVVNAPCPAPAPAPAIAVLPPPPSISADASKQDSLLPGQTTPTSPTSRTCSASHCRRCPLRSDSRSCRWEFRRYIPSVLEEQWWKVVDTHGADPCPAATGGFKEYFDLYFEAIAQSEATPDAQLPYGGCKCDKGLKPQALDPRVFSRFEYINSCTKEVEYSYIEPLAGILRHPSTCIDFGTKLRKDWLIVDQWELHKNDVFDQKFYYFDAGASVWTAGAGGASQAWFDSVYANKCANFDGYWMWEVTAHNTSLVMAQVPNFVKPKYRWFNIPAAIKKTDPDSPLRHIRESATREDYVMFKLDIDNNPVEEGIVKELVADPELMSLIDEFFWEHHINMHPMKLAWKDQISETATQRDSIQFFRTLREHGVRAHSWV
mmetsp:Transcript_1897/g.4158  ORF Transcript_1897/g.4158 Transcript_1897/m.4158 type:complete len:442 (-) Transcript_1897:141-1466(-)